MNGTTAALVGHLLLIAPLFAMAHVLSAQTDGTSEECATGLTGLRIEMEAGGMRRAHKAFKIVGG